MSDDEYNELEIETVAAALSAERAGRCEGDHLGSSDECEGDYYDHHHHSGGCVILITFFIGTAAFIVQILFGR